MCIFKDISQTYNNAHTVIYTWHSYKPESPKLELTMVSTQSEAPNLRIFCVFLELFSFVSRNMSSRIIIFKGLVPG